MIWNVYNKSGVKRCEVKELEYNGQFMGERVITCSINSSIPIDFEIGDYITYRDEVFYLDYTPSLTKKSSSSSSLDAFTYDLTFRTVSVELNNCQFLDYVLYGNDYAYQANPAFKFIGTVREFVERIKANMDRDYSNLWSFSIYDGAEIKEKEIDIENMSCWDALVFINEYFDLNFTISGRSVLIGYPEEVVPSTFYYGKDHGLYKIERLVNSEDSVVTRLYAYGGSQNIPPGYNKRNVDITGKSNLMIPGYLETGISYIESQNKDIYGIREHVEIFDDIYPSIEGVSINGIGRIDEIVSAEQITEETEENKTFSIEIKDIQFDINDYLAEGVASISFKTGTLVGFSFEITKVEKRENGNYTLTLNKTDSDGLIVPNKHQNLSPNDQFVLLNINMPNEYIEFAEKRLLEEAAKFLSNVDHITYKYDISVDELYMARSGNINKTIKEGQKLPIYDADLGIDSQITIQTLSIKEGGIIPTYDIQINDSPEPSTIDRIWSAIKDQKISPKTMEGVSRKYLRKDIDDTAAGFITFLKGLRSADFTMGEFGNGFILKYENGESYFEIDRMLVRKAAYFVELIIKQLSHVGGTVVLTPASMRCSKVEEYEEYYRCYFENEKDGKSIEQEFKVGDQARCQTFNVKQGVNHNVSSQYYWRLVVGIGDNYIDLSKIDCDLGSLAPLVGDDIVQLGNRNDETRQNAIILSSIGEDAPSIKQYEGINSYSLDGKEVTVISPYGNKFKGQFVSKANVDYEDILDSFGNRIDIVETQTDKTYMIWFYPHVPTLDNLPASEWIDDSVKEEHIKDMFYVESEDGLAYGEAGRAYRFVYSDSKGYYWEEITDKDTIQALEDAAKAQGTADSKIRNFVDIPYPPYEIGDRWCNATWKDENNDFIYDNDDLVCINSKTNKETDKFDIADWQPVSSQTSENRKLVEAKIKNLGDSLKLITSAFVKDENGNLVLTEQAGLNITSGMAQIYARKDDIINSINVSTEGITINSDKIDIKGAVTFSSLNKELQDTIDNKVNKETIIEGGYIKTSLIDVDDLVAKNLDADNGTVGGWYIGKDFLSNGKNDSTSVISSARLTMYSVENPGVNFLKLNPDSQTGLIQVRADNQTGLYITSDSKNGLCLYMRATTGASAAEVYGGVNWYQRPEDADIWNFSGLLAIVKVTNANDVPSFTRVWGNGVAVTGVFKIDTGKYRLTFTNSSFNILSGSFVDSHPVYPLFIACNPTGDKPCTFVSLSENDDNIVFATYALNDNEYVSRDAVSFYVYLFGRSRLL